MARLSFRPLCRSGAFWPELIEWLRRQGFETASRDYCICVAMRNELSTPKRKAQNARELAEGEGFEPPDPFGSAVFKTAPPLPQSLNRRQVAAQGNSDCPPDCPDSSDKGITLAPDLQTVIDAWLHLPQAVKAGILAMVTAVGRSSCSG